MPQESRDAGSEAQNLRLFCVPFSDSKTLQRILDALMKDFGVTGGSIIDCSSTYTFNGASFPAQTQYRLEFTIPSDGSIQTIVSFIEDAIKNAGWEVPFIQSTNVTLNSDAVSFVQAGHAEASRLRRVQKWLREGLAALTFLAVSLSGLLVHQHSVNKQNQEVLERIGDLQKEVERKILSIEETLAEGGSLERREHEIFGKTSFEQTQEVLRAVRTSEHEVQKILGKK